MPSTMLQRYKPEVVPLCIALALALVGSGCASGPGSRSGGDSAQDEATGDKMPAVRRGGKEHADAPAGKSLQ